LENDFIFKTLEIIDEKGAIGLLILKNKPICLKTTVE